MNGAAFRHRHSVDYSLGGGNQIFIIILRVVDKIKLRKLEYTFSLKHTWYGISLVLNWKLKFSYSGSIDLFFWDFLFFIRKMRSGYKGGEKVITFYGSASSLGTPGTVLTLQLLTQWGVRLVRGNLMFKIISRHVFVAPGLPTKFPNLLCSQFRRCDWSIS